MCPVRCLHCNPGKGTCKVNKETVKKFVTAIALAITVATIEAALHRVFKD